MLELETQQLSIRISTDVLLRGYCLVVTAKTMAETYEENFRFVSKYVHAVSRGHEAVQVALGMQLLPQDVLGPYYRDDAMMLAIGSTPLDMMLQLMAKRDDPFSGGRQYYCHTSLNDVDKPTIPHLSAATGMQAIPMTGAALGIAYKEAVGLSDKNDDEKPIVVCSFGDASELGRTCVLGKASAAIKEEFAFCLEARKFTLNLLRPGTPCKEIWDQYNAFMKKNKRPEEARLYCHGQGYDLVERPLIRNDEPLDIEADTNIVVHPTYVHRGIMSWVCDNWLIGKDGPGERIHKFPEMIVELG